MNRSGAPSRRIACLLLLRRPTAEAGAELLDVLANHSPAVEADHTPSGASLCYLDAYRVRDEPAWCQAVLTAARAGRLGLASTKFAAWVAAETAAPEPGYQVVTAPDASFLAPLPVTWLPLAAEPLRRLRLLGLGTIGQFAHLREGQVAEQLGPESLRAHRWARGLDSRPVIGQARQVVEAGYDFEVPENRREVLLEAAIRTARRAWHDLPEPRQAWAIRRLELVVTLTNGAVLRRSAWLGQTAEPPALRVYLGGLVDGLQGARAAIIALSVRLLGWEAVMGRQLSLFAHTETALRSTQALQQLAAKHSPACVVQAYLLDSHAPLAAERYALRAYRP